MSITLARAAQFSVETYKANPL